MIPSFWTAVFVSGLAAAVLSGLVLMVLALARSQSPVAPINATSQWLFGPRVASVGDVTVAETGVGLATHVASSVLWGGVTALAARWLGAERTGSLLLVGLGVAVVALILDYGLLPRRISPGWHLVLPWWAVGIGFLALGLGLGLGAGGALGRG